MIEQHVHIYDQRVKQKVTLYRGESSGTQSIVGYDWILKFKCKCGASQPYDLERHTA